MMTKTLLRAGPLSRALLATTALTALAMATPAYAQMVEPAPVRQSIDGNGVDLFDGTMTVTTPALTIGQADQGLSYHRLNRGTGWTDNLVASLNESGGIIMVSLGAVSDRFTVSGTTYTATEGNGATLTFNSGTNIYTYTRADGTVIRFDKVRSGTSPYYANRGRAIDITRPSGAKLTLAYDSLYYCSSSKPGGGGYVCTTHANAYRLATVTNGYGYRLSFAYSEIDPIDPDRPEILPDFATWSNVTGVTATNLAVSSGASTPSESFAFTTSGGITSYEVTDPLGRITSYRTTGTGVAGITLPGSSSEDVTIAYSGARVSSVTSAAAGTTTYAAADASGVRTVTVTDALSHATIYAFDIASRRLNSVTDALGHVTAFQYDGSGRTTRITRPEGNYTQFTYDARGNVTETRLVAKASTGLAPIVTSATYPSTCTNMATCNQPTTTTDAGGNVTDYVYDSTHGGVVSVTAPAPSTGATRPETRFSYTSLQAYFKNGVGSIVASGEPVYRMTGSSTCQSGSAPSCVGTANELVTSVSYGPQTTGTGNNLLPVSQTSANGTGTVTATTAMTYDDVGNLLTIDGPLSGTADTTRLRYNAARERIGAVSPDPDGAGTLKHRAQRATYNSLGQPSAVETGNVNSQSDADWASMTVLERAEQDYDAGHRPVVQRATAGGTTYALSQTSYDAAGRPTCTAQRMNPAEFATVSLPSDACTLDTAGSFGPDRIVRTSYDNANRTVLVETGYGVTGVAANEIVTTYRDNGQAETVTDANGNRTTYVYDGHDRLSQTRMPDPVTTGTSSATDYEELLYDSASRLQYRRLRDGQSIRFYYDALNRPTYRDIPSPTTGEGDVAYSYDNFGRPTLVTDSLVPYNYIIRAYDPLGRITLETTNSGQRGLVADEAGRLIRMDWDGGPKVQYDRLVTGEVSAMRENPAGANFTLATFGYDDRGRRTAIARGNGTSTSYAYDAVSRLSQLVQNLNGTTNDLTLDFTYNPAGQIVSNTRSNDAYSFTGHANVNIVDTHDGLNQLVTTAGTGVTEDARGNVTAIGGTAYAYTTDNRLRTAGTGTMTYGPEGALLSAASPSATTRFDSLLGHVIAERDGSGNRLRMFVPGPGVDEPMVWYEGNGTTTRRWFHQDERGSVIAVSDASGNLVGSLNRYDEYGVPQGALTGRFGYTGQLWLPEAGLYHYRNRAYNPSLGGRFMQADPIGYGGGMNLYAYVSGDPVNATDPSGLLVSCTGSIILHANGFDCGGPGGPANLFINGVNAAATYMSRENEIAGLLPAGTPRSVIRGVIECIDTSGCVSSILAGMNGSIGSGGRCGSADGADVLVCGSRFNLAYDNDPTPLQHPLVMVQMNPSAFSHIALRHYGVDPNASVFLPERRNPTDLFRMFNYAIQNSTPTPGWRPGTSVYSVTYPRPVGWERGTGRLTYNVTVVAQDTGQRLQTGHRVLTVITMYPGLPD